MRKKGVIFLDIDGTLLDTHYQVNDHLLANCIDEHSDKYIFCINSNRALEDLEPVARQFKIDGLLIGENGVFLYNAETKQQDYLLPENELQLLRERKKHIESTMLDIARKSFPGRRVHWKNTDTIAALSQQKSMDFEEGDIVILNNIFRQFTTSAHIKIYKNGVLFSMLEVMSIIEQALQQEFAQDPHITIASSTTFCNILAYSAQASKRSATEKLRSSFYPDFYFYAIGDEMDDFRMIESLGQFYTIANAPEDVKAVASAIATKPYAQGVRELIATISTRHR